MAGLEKNLKFLTEHLEPSELVEAAVLGAYETKIMGSDSVRNGIFVATNSRLVFFGKKLTGYDLESFPYENISSFEISKGMMGHTIAFHASGNSGKMKWINQGDVAELVQIVRSRMGKPRTAGPSAVPTPASAGGDPFEKLRKLAELRGQGVISQEDFEAKKAALLKSI